MKRTDTSHSVNPLQVTAQDLVQQPTGHTTVVVKVFSAFANHIGPRSQDVNGIVEELLSNNLVINWVTRGRCTIAERTTTSLHLSSSRTLAFLSS